MTPKVFERTYLALKREITSGAYVPGQRLQASALADILGTSTSPVTDAMRQMIGEDVLEYSSQDGFLIPQVTVRRIHDLYDLNAWLAEHSVRLVEAAGATRPNEPFTAISEDIVSTTEKAFVIMAAASQNGELLRLVANTNDRLRACRLIEPNLFNDLGIELEEIFHSWNNRDWEALRTKFSRYHARRLEAVPQLVSLSYRDRT